jgi:hypothetical protein
VASTFFAWCGCHNIDSATWANEKSVEVWLTKLATGRGNTRKAMASGFYGHACLVGDLEGANATVFRHQDMPANIVLGSVKDEARAGCLAGVTFLGNVISGE